MTPKAVGQLVNPGVVRVEARSANAGGANDVGDAEFVSRVREFVDGSDDTGAEFLALSDCVWAKPDPSAALTAFSAKAKA